MPFQGKSRRNSTPTFSVTKEAALMLAQDFSIPYEDRKNTGKQPIRPRLRRESEEQKFKRMERHCFRVLSDYYHLLRRWKEEHAPRQPDEAWNPRFIEALQNMSRLEYLMDVLLSGELPERAALITGHGKEVRNLERRMAELTARDIKIGKTGKSPSRNTGI